MSKQNHSLLPFLIVGFSLCLIGASVYSSGAPSGYSGAPGDGTCVVCHSSYPLNSGDGSVVVEAPATFDVGAPINLIVRTSKPGAARLGFQITVRDTNGSMAGAFELTDGTQFADLGITTAYVTHAATAPRAADTYQWVIRWVPPTENATDVTFYAAGNAANGDNYLYNDFIYTTSAEVKFAGNTAVESQTFPERLTLKTAFPNPADRAVAIAFSLDISSTVKSFLYDGVGRVVAQSESEFFFAGEGEITLDTAALPAGMYSYRVEASGHSRTGLIAVIH